MADDNFYEDDEPVERIRALFDEGPHGVTGPPTGRNLRIDVTDGLTPAIQVTQGGQRPTREQYAELGARILAALPVDPDDGTCVIGYGADGFPLWGDPQKIVDRIEGVFFQMDLAVVPGAELDALRHAVNRVRALLVGCDACALADEIAEILPTVRALPPEAPH